MGILDSSLESRGEENNGKVQQREGDQTEEGKEVREFIKNKGEGTTRGDLTAEIRWMVLNIIEQVIRAMERTVRVEGVKKNNGTGMG